MNKYIDEVIADFENELDLWLETKEHNYNCMARSEGQNCCLDKDKSALSGNVGRDWTVKFLKQALTEQERKIKEDIAGKVEKLRNGVLARSGPNDTPHTRLAELSLFQEIKQLLTPLPSSTEE